MILFIIGAAVFCVLGLSHGALTIRDLSRPTSFTPTDESVRRVMAESPLRFAPQTTIWLAWLGFNLSHSLGLLTFGGVLILLAVSDYSIVSSSLALRGLSISVAAVYMVLAMRFWFWAPAVGSGLGVLCFVASALLG